MIHGFSSHELKTSESSPALVSFNRESSWRFWTIPNILSIFRIVVLVPTIWALINHRNLLAFILFVGSSITDALDGMIARRFHQESEWGKVLDPIADKLTLNTLALIMAFQGRIPVFLALIVFGRDAAILSGSLILLTSKTFVPQANVAGKITGIAFFAMLCAGLLNVRWLLRYIVPVVTVLVIITLVHYSYRFINYRIRFGKEKKGENPGFD